MSEEWEDNSTSAVDLIVFASLAYVGIFYWKDILAFISSGGFIFGGGVYPRTGRVCHGNNHSQTIGCGGGNSPSKRYDCGNCNFSAHEVTAQIQFGGGCGCGDEATIKHGGPEHSDGNCCWAISVVRQSGQCSFGGEGPHGSDTDLNQQSLGSVGNLQNKTVTINSVFWTTGSGAHQELYVNGRRMGSRNMAAWGDAQKTSRMPGSQQIECRCDCSGARWLHAEVAEIRPPFGAVTYPSYQTAVKKATNVGRRAVLSDMVDNAATEKPTLYEFQQDLAYFPPVDVPKPPIAESFLTQRWLGRKL